MKIVVKNAGFWEVEPERSGLQSLMLLLHEAAGEGMAEGGIFLFSEFALCMYSFFLTLVLLRIAEFDILLGLERPRIQLLAFVHIEQRASHVLDIPNPFECRGCIIN